MMKYFLNLKKKLNFFLEDIIYPIVNTTFPNFCWNCESLLVKDQNLLCPACEMVFNHLKDRKVCKICSLYYLLEGDICQYCKVIKDRYFDHNISVFGYDGLVKDLILEGKFKSKAIIFKFLSKKMANFLKGKKLDGNGIFIPVPLFKKRERIRGFNQSDILVKGVSRFLGLPYSRKVLLKTKDNVPQSQLSQKEKFSNPGGAYQVRNRKLIDSRIVYLIDDVFTTGATINECSRVLKEFGAKEVISLTLAKS